MKDYAGSGTSPFDGVRSDLTPTGVEVHTGADPRAPSRIPFGKSSYTKKKGRLLSEGEVRQIADLFRGNAGLQDVMDVLQFRGNFEAFRRSLEDSGYILIRKLEPIKRKKTYQDKPELTPAQLALIQEVFLKPHSIRAAADYFGEHIGYHVSSPTRLLHALERSGFTYRNAIVGKESWKEQLSKLQQERERLTQTT